MGTCGTCKHFVAERDSSRPIGDARLGSCDRWLTGYHTTERDIPDDGVLVESDEGWCMKMGRNFGCVLWEKADASPR